jgi:hypothetical protein
MADTTQPEKQIDSQWFRDQLADRKLTQRAAAKLLNLDPSSLSLLLDGHRRMRIDQAGEFARVFKLPISEIVRRAGVETTGGMHGRLNVVGYIEGTGRAVIREDAPGAVVQFQWDLPEKAMGLQFRTAQSAADVWDGFIAAFGDSEPGGAGALDRTGLIRMRSGEELYGKARRGYAPNLYTVIPLTGELIHDADIESFKPLIGLRPI